MTLFGGDVRGKELANLPTLVGQPRNLKERLHEVSRTSSEGVTDLSVLTVTSPVCVADRSTVMIKQAARSDIIRVRYTQLWFIVALQGLRVLPNVAQAEPVVLTHPIVTQSVLTLGPKRYHVNTTIYSHSEEESDYCAKITSPDIRGGIHVFSDAGDTCPEEAKYRNMAKAGMAARIMLSPLYTPGCNIYLWSWQYAFGGIDIDGFIFLDAFDPDLKFLDNVYGSRVVLFSDGTPSDWQKMWEGGVWTVFVRILPTFFVVRLVGYGKALLPRVRELHENGAQLSVLGGELAAWIMLCIFFAVHGFHGSSPTLPYELIGLGQAFLTGSGFFTKIIMAFLLYETRKGVKEMRQVKPILQAYKRALVASFVVFVIGLDMGMVIAFMTTLHVGDLITICIACVLVGQLGVAFFFFYQGFNVAKLLMATHVDAPSGNLTPGAAAGGMYHRMCKWLAISGVFMLVLVIALILFAVVVPYTPSFIFFQYCTIFIARAGGTIAQFASMVPLRRRWTKKRAGRSSLSSSNVSSLGSITGTMDLEDDAETTADECRSSSKTGVHD